MRVFFVNKLSILTKSHYLQKLQVFSNIDMKQNSFEKEKIGSELECALNSELECAWLSMIVWLNLTNSIE